MNMDFGIGLWTRTWIVTKIFLKASEKLRIFDWFALQAEAQILRRFCRIEFITTCFKLMWTASVRLWKCEVLETRGDTGSSLHYQPRFKAADTMETSLLINNILINTHNIILYKLISLSRNWRSTLIINMIY